MGEAMLMSNGGGISNNDLDILNNNINMISNRIWPMPTYYLYDSTTFLVPYDTGITIRACGKGGNYANRGGGGGGGYVKDYREYKKGDIITITFTNGKVEINQSDRNLSLIANPGSNGQVSYGIVTSYFGGEGGTASGGNILNATGGKGGMSSDKGTHTAPESSEGCGGGGAEAVTDGGTSHNGAQGGFSGGNGSGGSRWGISHGGQGGFSGGKGGDVDTTSGYPRAGGTGGYSPYGIGGHGGSTNYGTGGTGGTGFLAGGNGGNGESGGQGGDCTGSSLKGKGGIGTTATGADGSGTDGMPFLTAMPKHVNHGGGNGGIAACIIELGESIYPY